MDSYHHRFNEVLKYINFHLDEELDLDTLARIASVSKFHFHRLIKSHLGESIGTYINRLRIETGARLLKYSDSSIVDISYKVGYEVPTSFNKSFKKLFGVSPSYFRKNTDHSFELIKTSPKKLKYKLTITEENIESILILTNQSKGLIGSKETSKIWDELMFYAMKNNLVSNIPMMYGLHWDDPSITEKQNLRYDACISISKEIKHSKFITKKIKGGKYMTFIYRGDYQYLGNVYDQIFREYILTKNILLREEPLFDQYINDKKQTAPNELITKIFVPIQ